MIHIVLYVGRMLTYFPRKAGVSDTYSPRMIMQGKPLDAQKDLALDIGCYCEVPKQATPRNSQKARTQPALCLGPVGK